MIPLCVDSVRVHEHKKGAGGTRRQRDTLEYLSWPGGGGSLDTSEETMVTFDHILHIK